MGDDVFAPHEQERHLPDNITIRGAIEAIIADRYLALIYGGQATWVLETVGGNPIAVVAQQWNEPRLLNAGHGLLASLSDSDGDLRLHFAYLAQRDPDLVHAQLANE
ncbi:hypothetical protein [Kitasatospora sp. LaBMicrA B282]|uniref:hypothetical protein n=1 Tax=Kitasatospora sp. LaBMicrA B282 TaxID=3420949 RepID=UPI003D0E5CDE